MQTWLPDWSRTHLIHSTFKLPITVDVVVTIWTSSGATYKCLIHDHFKKHIILRAKLSFLFSKHSNRTRIHSSRLRTNQWPSRGGGGRRHPPDRHPLPSTPHPCENITFPAKRSVKMPNWVFNSGILKWSSLKTTSTYVQKLFSIHKLFAFSEIIFIGGSSGHQGRMGSKFFHFHAVYAKKLVN